MPPTSPKKVYLCTVVARDPFVLKIFEAVINCYNRVDPSNTGGVPALYPFIPLVYESFSSMKHATMLGSNFRYQMPTAKSAGPH